MNTKKKWLIPLGMWLVFEIVAVTLWLTQDNLFYLLNFSYIGSAIALGLLLFQLNYRHARRIVQLLVGLYMLVYLGLICQENMQIEGFWYYLFTGVFEAATIHYVVAKIFGPLLFGRGWCGYACWTAMVLDFLPYKTPKAPRKKSVLSDISPLLHRLFLWEHCFYATWRTLSKLCSGHFLLAISCIMPLESFWHLCFGIIGHSVNISAQLPYS